MIDCYMAATTNSRRASVGLSEAGLAYTAHAMNLREKDQQSIVRQCVYANCLLNNQYLLKRSCFR